jgi:hypothetical protein
VIILPCFNGVGQGDEELDSQNGVDALLNAITVAVSDLRRRYARPSFGRAGRFGIDGTTLINCAYELGVREIAPPRIRKRAYVTPMSGGHRLAIAVRGHVRSSYAEAVAECLDEDATLRWIFAHELGHVWLDNAESGRDPRACSNKPVEAVCQRFAAELLLPRERVEQVVCAHSRSVVEAILKVARRLGVPVRASIRRTIRELQLIDAAVVLMSERVAKSWESRRVRRTELPPTGVEVFVGDDGSSNFDAEKLYNSELVRWVCRSAVGPAGYHALADVENGEFSEGLRLDDLAPTGSAFVAFAKAPPPACLRCTEARLANGQRTLFD